MHKKTLEILTEKAKSKVRAIETGKLGYLVSCIFASIYVGIAGLLIFTVGGMLGDSPFAKVVMGASFTVALTLVMFTGSELFTGNNMYMTAGYINKGVKGKDVIKVWGFSYIGNFIGAILIGLLIVGTGVLSYGDTMKYFGYIVEVKVSYSVLELICKGILGNMLVCVALLCGIRTNNDSAKITIIFLCLYTFIVCKFEHSIANMTTFAMVFFESNLSNITLAQAFYNVFFVTIGNIIGGSLILGAGTAILGKSEK